MASAPASATFPPAQDWAALAPPPGSVAWRKVGDPRLTVGAGYALLLQVGHPTVGAGVAEHSDFMEDPWGRLIRTLDFLNGVIYGGPELAGQIGIRVRTMHQAIRGRKADGSRYHALEPEAYAWVHATLAASVVHGHELFGTPFTESELEQFWDEWLKLSRLLGIRDGELPESWAEFDPYFNSIVSERLERTAAVGMVLQALERPKRPLRLIPNRAWKVLRVPAAQLTLIGTAGLLGNELRERFELPWSPGRERLLRVAGAASRAGGIALIGPLGNIGPGYVRVRRRQLEAMDFAARGMARVEAERAAGTPTPA